MAPFQYSPLGPDEIRLLKIDWNRIRNNVRHPAPDGSISCTITHHPLISPPPYTALSYMWGSDSESYCPHILRVNGNGTLKIRCNLYDFLCQVMPSAKRKKHKKSRSFVGFLWIDALCINQEDFEEKSRQIPLMARIYSSAKRIVMWLGNPSDETDRAMDIYSRISAAAADGTLPAVSPSSLRQIVSPKDSKQLCGFNGLPYWKRSWIYQEASTPCLYREVWYGVKKQPFQSMITTVMALLNHERAFASYLKDKPASTSILVLGLFTISRQIGDGAMSLLDLLFLAAGLYATVEADKVYAMLNIYRDINPLAEKDEPIRVDYNLPIEDLNQIVTEHILKFTRRADALLLCCLYNQECLRKSWVPDIYELHKVGSDAFQVHARRSHFDAGGDEWLPFSIGSGDRTGILTVRGVRFETLAGVHKPVKVQSSVVEPREMGDVEFWVPRLVAWMKVLTEWLQQCGQGEEAITEKPYVAGGTVSEAADWVLGIGGPLSLDGANWKWPWRQFAFLNKIDRNELEDGDGKGDDNGENDKDNNEDEDDGNNDDENLKIDQDEEKLIKWLSTKLACRDYLEWTIDMALFRTGKGYLGIGPNAMAVNDVLVIIPGLNMPLLLRPSSETSGQWKVVCGCWVKGIMDGEGLKAGDEEEFDLI
ncbi:heterokaryon incompatibility protein-domain-containing protein [Podospora fimiseda]|uniref:Heterokaryon incompatibility protein-domain-containing protein n=1 Tax=Podospora fimiseda TaxID=252190 RepID=A0AAN7BNS9_9PEZI|nr:heterokaryon incompatibility protein-domain-containing protein [Podospora fimiseda]